MFLLCRLMELGCFGIGVSHLLAAALEYVWLEHSKREAGLAQGHCSLSHLYSMLGKGKCGTKT